LVYIIDTMIEYELMSTVFFSIFCRSLQQKWRNTGVGCHYYLYVLYKDADIFVKIVDRM